MNDEEAKKEGQYQEESVKAIREGIESAEKGNLKPANQVFKEMKKKSKIK